MKIEKISKTKDKSVFLIKGIKNSIANAIRRSVYEVPILSIDSIEFYKNDSALYDEIIAQRLGLIPLKADLKTFKKQENCSCEGKGCNKCTISLKLKAKGPCTVYASELKGKGFEVIYPQMPIVVLAQDQELEIVAEARLGTGREHAKFTPGIIWFNAQPIIEISKECNSCGECTKVCPKKAISLQGNKINIDINKCDLCGACIEKCNTLKKAIKIDASEEDFTFYTETFGQISSDEIFIESLNSLNEKLEELSKKIEKSK